MELQISIVVGNPKPQSRTRCIAENFVDQMFGTSAHTVNVIDLVDYKDEILAWPSEKMNDLNERVANSDVAVFASPTYKATYTGMLKAFLDRYPANGLAGVTTIPIMTGAGLGHAMGPTVNFAPLLVELGGIVPGRGFYFVTDGMDRVDEIVQSAVDEHADNLRRMAHVSAGLLASAATRESEAAR